MESADPKSNAATPIWHRPGWITAIVGLITVILTTPGVVTEAQLERQERKQKANQDRFAVVQTVLKVEDREQRLMLLRYIVATGKGGEKQWARSELDLIPSAPTNVRDTQ